MNLFRKLFGDKHEEIKSLKEEIVLDKKKDIKDLRLINKRFKAIVSDMQVEFVIKNISEIKDGK